MTGGSGGIHTRLTRSPGTRGTYHYVTCRTVTVRKGFVPSGLARLPGRRRRGLPFPGTGGERDDIGTRIFSQTVSSMTLHR